jgi:hypothetical protein
MYQRTLPRLLALAIAIVISFAAACTARPTPAPSAAASPPAPVSASAPLPPVHDALTLAQRLSAERSARPAGALRTEDVALALQKGGIGIGPMTQVLGASIGARYCAMATTSDGLGVAVCEFGDAAEAERGLDYSRRTFDPLIPGRRLARNRGTVLTLTAPDARSPARATEAGLAAAIFAAL